jgi:hypothetical protein
VGRSQNTTPASPLHEAAGQLIKPGLVLAPDAGQLHAPAAAGGAGRIPHALLAKAFAGGGHEPVQLVGHARIGAAFAPCGGYAPRPYPADRAGVR